MPSNSHHSDHAAFMAEHLDAEMERQQTLKTAFESVSEPAMGEALALYSFMSSLPSALLVSQQREARRLERTSQSKDPRLEALQASMADTARLVDTTRLGHARVERVLASLSDQRDVFHGFVSDHDLRGLQGYAVRIARVDGGGKEPLKAVTEDDGYFCIDLDVAGTGKKTSGRRNDRAQLIQAMSDLFGLSEPVGVAAAASPAVGAKTEAVQVLVEIFDPSGLSVHQDHFPIQLDGGSVYREYVVQGQAGGSDLKRYAGNASTRELHDTRNLKKRCNFETIDAGTLTYFADTSSAERAGYDYCAHCFGKTKSRR